MSKKIKRFENWFQTAAPGDKFMYHKGPAWDREIMDHVYDIACLGVIDLVQKKIRKSIFEYFAIKRKEVDKHPPEPKFPSASSNGNIKITDAMKAEYDKKVYKILCKAADARDHAPLNKEMQAAIGISRHSVSASLVRLCDSGKIIIKYRNRRRRFHIVKTGNETKEPAYLNYK